jgi:hypothetical protein
MKTNRNTGARTLSMFDDLPLGKTVVAVPVGPLVIDIVSDMDLLISQSGLRFSLAQRCAGIHGALPAFEATLAVQAAEHQGLPAPTVGKCSACGSRCLVTA